jgi:hypothetical protein
MSQTSIQQETDIEFGSVKFEIGPDVGSLVDVGVLRDAKFRWTYTEAVVKSDNGGIIKRGITDEKAIFGANIMEFNFDRLAAFYSGVLTKTVVAADPTAVTREDHELNDTDVEWLTYADGDGTEVASIVVKDATGTTTYTRNTEYVVIVGADGRTGIARTGTTILDGATVRVAYSYTPNASVVLKAGGKLVFDAQVARFTNTNAAGKTRVCTIYSATPSSGISIDFPADDDVDPWMCPIEIVGVCDVDRAEGDQLFVITKET